MAISESKKLQEMTKSELLEEIIKLRRELHMKTDEIGTLKKRILIYRSVK